MRGGAAVINVSGSSSYAAQLFVFQKMFFPAGTTRLRWLCSFCGG